MKIVRISFKTYHPKISKNIKDVTKVKISQSLRYFIGVNEAPFKLRLFNFIEYDFSVFISNARENPCDQ